MAGVHSPYGAPCVRARLAFIYGLAIRHKRIMHFANGGEASAKEVPALATRLVSLYRLL